MNNLNSIILEGKVNKFSVLNLDSKEAVTTLAVSRTVKNSEGNDTVQVTEFDVTTFGLLTEKLQQIAGNGGLVRRGIRVVGRLIKNERGVSVLAEYIEFKAV